VLLGGVVLVIAIFALRNPKSHVSAGSAAATTVVSSSTRSAGPRTTSSKSTAAAKPAGAATSSRNSAAGSSSDSPAASGVKSVPLVVLNNTETAGLAGLAAKRFEAGGWTVSSTGNLSNNIISTCAYYDPAATGAKDAAEALREQFPTIKRVKARFAGLPDGPVVVVLTPGYSSD
jgi:hypothetical protein